MKQNNIFSRRLLTPLMLMLALGGCHAQTSLGGTPPSAAAPNSAMLAANYKGTYLFDLIDGTNKMHIVKLLGVPDYASAFKQLTIEQTKKDRRFVERLTSGPSTRGEVASTRQGQSIVHTTCQAHACNMTRLGVLYAPESGRMVGLLWDNCSLTQLGTPSTQEIEILARVSKIPAETPENKKKCEQER